MPSRKPSKIKLLSFFAIAVCAAAQPAKVGTIPGSFDVTSTGSATYSISVKVAPGTAGTEPKLSLVYDSQSTTGALGAGWSIAGLTTITRGPRNLEFDGRVSGVKLNDEDALYLEGQKLVQVAQSGAGAGRIREYRKEIDDVSRIIQTGTDFGSSTFVVETKGGLKLIFDGSNQSRVLFADGTTLLLAASRIVDTAGNYIEFRYLQNGFGDYNVATVRYSGHEVRDSSNRVINDLRPYATVDFDYEIVPRPIETFISGRLLRRDSRLKGVVSRVSRDRDDSQSASWVDVARYRLEYEERDSADRSVLVAVHEYGDGGSELQPTRFSYSKPDTAWASAQFQLPIIPFAHQQNLSRAFRFAHFTSGAKPLPDLLFAAQVDGKLESFAYRNDSGAWTKMDGYKPPFAFASDDGSDLGTIVIDLNGDGRADLLKSYQHGTDAPERAAFLAGQDKWDGADNYKLPFNLSENGKVSAIVLFGKFSGGSGPDLIYESRGLRGFLANTATGWVSDHTHAPPIALTAGARLMDVDCDGKPELITPFSDNGTTVWKVFRYSASGWIPITDKAFEPPYLPALPPAAIRELDLNGDSCPDVIFSSANDSIRGAFLASNAGWISNPDKAPPFDLVDSTGISVGATVLDLDSDGRLDVVASKLAADGTQKNFAFRQTPTGWERLSGAWPPPIPIDETSSAFIGDIDGDGRPDILSPTGHRDTLGRVFLGSPTGFVEKPNYAPEVVFGRRDQQDRGIRFVDLNGDGLPDIIYRRDDTKDGKIDTISGAFLNTGHGWQPAPGLIPPLPFASESISGSPVQFVDVDGDGVLDLLYSYKKSDGTQVRAYYRNQLSATGDRAWIEQVNSPLVPPQDFPFAQEGTGDLGVRFVDLNGDGLVDMLVGVLKTKSETSNADPAEICVPAISTPPVGAPPIEPQTCHLNRSVFQVTAFINNGTAWVNTPAYAPPVPFVYLRPRPKTPSQDLYVELVDVNGDRLPDLVAKFQHPYDSTKTVWETWINTGTGWLASDDSKVPLLLDEPGRNSRNSIQWMDVNGDGLADIVMIERHGGVNNSTTWLSTGKAFVASAAWQVPLAVAADRDTDSGFRLTDINGDGYVDIVYARKSDATKIERGAYTNTGTGWAPVDSSKVSLISPFVDELGADLGVRLLDVDGNGLPDVVRSFASGDSLQVLEQDIFLNTSRRSSVLTDIEVGYGLSTSLSYQTLLETDDPGSASGSLLPWRRLYEPAAGSAKYPVIFPVPASYVVRRVVMQAGAKMATSVSYRYGAFATHLLALRPLGFAWRESFNESTGVLAHQDFLQDVIGGGRVRRSATCLIQLTSKPAAEPISLDLCPSGLISPWRTILEETVLGHTVSEGRVSSGAGSVRIWQVTLSNSTSSNWELDGMEVSKETTSIEYDVPPNPLDRHMNVKRTRAARSDGSSVELVNEYGLDNPSRWILGRLSKTTTIKTGDPITLGSTQRKTDTRLSLFSYETDTGLLTSETTNADQTQSLTKTYTRDAYGNIVAVTLSAQNELDKQTGTEYDQLGRFIISTTNARQHKVSIRPRLTTGLPDSITDPNGLRTLYAYDGFGRTISVTLPTGLVTRTEYLNVSDISDAKAITGIDAAYATKETSGDLPPLLSIFDNRGHVIRSVAEGFSLNDKVSRPVHRDYVYDAQGRNISTSAPYFRGDSAKWTTIAYDTLGRAVNVISPSSAKIQVSFAGRPGGGRITTKRDASNHLASSETNTRGLVVSVADQAKGTVTYTYDGADRVESVTGALGSVTRTKFDSMGRPQQIIDPDMGSWTYSYDAFGQLRKQVDAKGLTTVIDYDDLGRAVSKITGDGATIQWRYDTAQHGIGQLASTRIPNKFEKTQLYDQFGRLSTVSITVGDESYATHSELDKYGRVTETSYPSAPGTPAVIVQDKYDAKGYFNRVTSKDGLDLYWEALDLDASGRVINERYGNDVTTERTFNSVTGRLERSKVTSRQGENLLDLSLQYNDVGDLLQRREVTRSIDERFEYDDLDRLVKYRAGANAAIETVYDAAGRITSKTGVGDFQYNASASGSWQPIHAVSAVQTATETKGYNYDPNGNLLSRPGGQFRFNADNRLAEVSTDATHWRRFEYDPSGDRYLQTSQTGNARTETIYCGAFERTTEFDDLGDKPTVARVRFRYSLINGTGVFATIEVVVKPAGAGKDIKKPSDVGETTRNVWYLHSDHIGSVLRISDASGKLAARFWYDPWGKRVTAEILQAGQALSSSWTRGLSGQEEFFDVALIHMNGRVFDSLTGMFLSPDPISLPLGDTQGLDRYAYAHNNPLTFTDPTGYWDWGGAIIGAIGGFIAGGPAGAVVGAIAGGNDDTRKWVEQNWKEVVIVGVAVGVTVATGGAGCAVTCAILSGMAAGAASGGVSAALYGGNFDDVIAGAARGAIFGGITAGAFYGVGSAFSGAAGTIGAPDSIGAIAAHGAVGGGVEALEGGNFWTGFAAGSFTKASSVLSPELASPGARIARAAIVGGSVAAIAGGKFANGALIGAFSYTFNDLAHRMQWVSAGAAVGTGFAFAGSIALDASTGSANLFATPAEMAFAASAGGALGGFVYDAFVTGEPPPLPDFDFHDPSKPPVGPDGKPWDWRGQEPVGGPKGGYVNPSAPGQSLHPDLGHGPPGPHWDQNDRATKGKWRVWPDGSVTPK